MIIGVSGKIGSGKDTVGSVIQYIISNKIHNQNLTYNEWLELYPVKNEISGWKIIKWADKPKDMICILLGCTREQLEDREFKETKLGEEWTRYSIAKGFWSHSDNNPSHRMMDDVQCDKETYEAELRINWQTAYKTNYTPRILLQYIGTDLFRKFIHENVWVNATLRDYKISRDKSFNEEDFEIMIDGKSEVKYEYPNWIITDTRFPNEADAIKQRGGINIRIQKESDEDLINPHISETALDFYQFDYIVNHGTIENLIEQVREILIKENII